MTQTIWLYRIITLTLTFAACVAFNYIKTHTIPPLEHSHKLHPIKTVTNEKTKFLYELESGVVYKKKNDGIHTVHAHAHVICSTLRPEGKIFGIIEKEDTCKIPQTYYVYTNDKR